uniref:type VI secretion system Vgr family protein n=1 Tax=Flavobacterium sp. TaxID=239 RepID=UPI00286BCA75
EMIRSAGASGIILIEGFSPSIVMDGTPNAKSFSDKSFADIVRELSANYPQQELKPNIDFSNDSSLPYTVQYGESDFAFLSRMAQKKGEWFYYNGEQTFFGRPKSKNIDLVYGHSLHKLSIGIQAKPLGFEYVGYDPSSAETQKANSKEINFQTQGYTKSVYDASRKMYPNTATSLYGNPMQEGMSRNHLVNRVTTQLQSKTSNLVVAKGESDETGIRIGDVLVITESSFSSTGNASDGVKEQNFGSYIVTEITHNCDISGRYFNTFEAVPDSILSPPYSNVFQIPQADTQPAVVIDNNDPKGLGRVQVQMMWQKDNSANTPWIRMTNPHAGGGKGMYYIPEIGEEVLVGFENNNAEKPFVLGAMYNGNESSGYNTEGNDQKVIQTRSGTKIIMNDAIGSVFIEDPSGNTWLMDGKGNISANAPNDFTINAGKNISITAGMNISTSAGVNISENAGVDKSTSIGMMHNVFVGGNSVMNVIGKLTEYIEGDVHSETKQERTHISEGKVTSQSTGSHEQHSKKEIKNNAAEKSKLF